MLASLLLWLDSCSNAGETCSYVMYVCTQGKHITRTNSARKFHQWVNKNFECLWTYRHTFRYTHTQASYTHTHTPHTPHIHTIHTHHTHTTRTHHTHTHARTHTPHTHTPHTHTHSKNIQLEKLFFPKIPVNYLYVSLNPVCSVLDLDAFERCKKAEDLGDAGGMNTTNSNLNDASNSLRLFRFLQLLCEGHNLGVWIFHSTLLMLVTGVEFCWVQPSISRHRCPSNPFAALQTYIFP